MSWIFGYFGKQAERFIPKFRTIHKPALFLTTTNQLYIASGGNSNTCLFTEDIQVNSGRLLNGIVSDPSTHIFYSSLDIAAFENLHEKLYDCNGHYVAVTWQPDSCTFSCDALGMREMYVAPFADGYLFSSRIDWLAQMITVEIDFREFGSRWLLFNQMNRKSFIKGISRYSAGDIVKLQEKGIEVITREWFPQAIESMNLEQFDDVFESVLNGMFANKHHISLSLSGGMDSRLLLAFLDTKNRNQWDAHTFGLADLPDRIIAERLAAQMSCGHFCISNNAEQCSIEELVDFAGTAQVTQTATAFLQLRNYDTFGDKNYLLIDGGYGEIWRRAFSAKALLTKRGAMMQRNAPALYSGFRSQKADIFSDDVTEVMKEGAIEQINELNSFLPDIQAIGAENWLDLIALKIRFQNYFGPEQVRMDAITMNLMPFMQKSLLENLFAVPLNLKKDGYLFKEIIRRRSPKLLQTPLVKGNVILPAGLNTWQSRVWGLAVKLLRTKKPPVHQNAFFLQHAHAVTDYLRSANVQQSGKYNLPYINAITENLHKGIVSDTVALDWLYSYVLFQLAIQAK